MAWPGSRGMASKLARPEQQGNVLSCVFVGMSSEPSVVIDCRDLGFYGQYTAIRR